MKLEWDGGKLTKELALLLCWKLWEWLAETGTALKGSWPEWALKGGKVKWMHSGCPCCQHVGQGDGFENSACRQKCPLIDLWPHLCMWRESPFHKWHIAETPAARKKYASIIAEAARKEYEAKP